MKEVINGKLYNTGTSTLVEEWYNGIPNPRLGHCEESLYRTAEGAYFVAGHGGPFSRWSTPCGPGRDGGSGIIALTPAEALAWCEEHDVAADIIAEHFTTTEA